MPAMLPDGQSLFIRANFDDDAGWHEITEESSAEQIGPDGAAARAELTIVDNPEFDGLAPTDIVSNWSADNPSYVFIVDATTLTDEEHPILAVDRRLDTADDQRSFRLVPRVIAMIENNLSIGNVDFSEFREACDDDGVFRGFAVSASRDLLVADLLDAAPGSRFPSTVLARYVEALAHQTRESISAKVVADVSPYSLKYQSNYANYRYCTELLGLDETIATLGRGGPALLFGLPQMGAHWTVFVDPSSLKVLAALMTRM